MRWIHRAVLPTCLSPSLALLAAGLLLVSFAAPSPGHAAAGAPQIELAWPQPAAVGDLVVLRGREFHPKTGKNRVLFGALEARVLEVVEGADWTMELKVTVPLETTADGALPLTVEVGGRRSAPLEFFLRPVVVAPPVPALAAEGTARLTLQVLGSSEPEPVEVVTLTPGTATLGGRVSDVTLSRPTQTMETTETGRRRNLATVTLTASPPAPGRPDRTASPPRIFARPVPPAADLACPDPLTWLGEGPQILEIVPASAGPGEPVHIRGRDFGDHVEDLRVTLGDQPVDILDLQPGEMLVQLPPDAASGPVRVQRLAGSPGDGEMATSNDFFLPITPQLQLGADRLDLLRGQISRVTATLVGTAEPTELTVVVTTPRVARLEGEAVSGIVTTSGGEPNQVTFQVRGVREGRFELVATALLAPDAPARATVTVPRIAVPPSSPDQPGTGEGITVPVEGIDQAGRPRDVPAAEMEWRTVPENLGTVDPEGRFRPATEAGCGVLVGRWGETLPVVVPVEVGGGPFLQAAPQDEDCDWRKICIDFYFLASPRQGGGFEITVWESFRDMLGPTFRAKSLPLQAGDFAAAGGALAPLKGKAEASDLEANLRNLLAKLSQVYEPCCIWFDLGEVYAVDPARAQISGDGKKLDEFIDDEGATDVAKEVETEDGEDTFLDAAQRFVEDHSGLEDNDCLKMFLVPDLTGGGGEAGKAQDNGDFSVVGADRIRPQDSGFVPAHEVGHNLMGGEHWERTDEQGDRQFNVMEEAEPSVRHGTGNIFVDEDSQCPRARRRAEAIGTEEDPPAEDEEDENAEDAEDEGDGDEDGEGGEGEDDGGQGGEDSGPPAEEDGPPGDQEEECPCDDPRAATQGLQALEELRIESDATATATFTTCCGVVRLTVEVAREISDHDYTWQLEFDKTREDCFESFVLDRYYNSKPFRYAIGGGWAEEPVQVKELELTALGEGRFRLRGDDGFERDYEGEPDILSEEGLDDDHDNSLNHDEDVTSWNVVLGGVVRCKDSEASRAFPFHFVFRKASRGEIELEGASGILPDEKAGSQGARRNLVKDDLVRLDGE